MNYYQILGITKKSTNDEIKAAYRKLIKTSHPDVGGDPNRFYSIQKAYETLIDPNLREEYEYRNILSFEETSKYHYEEIKENEDIRLPLELSIKDIILGKDISISYKLKSGITEHAEIIIPPGISKSTNLVYTGLGESCYPNSPRGNLIFEITVDYNKNWKIKDNDLHTTLTINAIDMIVGCNIALELPDESVTELIIPKGTQNDTVISISDCGIPDLQTGERGKVFVKIKPKIPKIRNNDVLDRLREIRDQIS